MTALGHLVQDLLAVCMLTGLSPHYISGFISASNPDIEPMLSCLLMYSVSVQLLASAQICQYNLARLQMRRKSAMQSMPCSTSNNAAQSASESMRTACPDQNPPCKYLNNPSAGLRPDFFKGKRKSAVWKIRCDIIHEFINSCRFVGGQPDQLAYILRPVMQDNFKSGASPLHQFTDVIIKQRHLKASEGLVRLVK